MVDLSDKGSESDDMNSRTPDRVSSEGDKMRTCTDCGTMKTPLWRGGPAGPKSLCNACGIRSRKRRRALLGLNKTEDKKPKRLNGNSNGNGNNHNRKLGESIKMMKLFALSSLEKKLRRKLGEEEQAAVLLMALSCGSVYA